MHRTKCMRLFLYDRKLRPIIQKRSARMRTRRKGRWLLKQPRLGAGMCQGTFFFSQFVMQVLQVARHLNCHCQILQAASFQRNISILICASFISHKFTFFLQKLLQNMIESFFHTYYAEKQKKAEKYCIHSREEVQCHQPDRLWNAWQTGR